MKREKERAGRLEWEEEKHGLRIRESENQRIR